MANKRIVITGLGPISSIGIGKKSLWENLLLAKTNIQQEKTNIGNELWDSFYYHKVDNFDISKFGINEDSLEYIKDWKEGEEIIDLYYLLAAIKLAMVDSQLIDSSVKNANMGLVLAHENLNLIPFISKLSEQAFKLLTDKENTLTQKEFYEKIYKTCLKTGYDVQPFMTLFHVAKAFDIHDHSLFICNACASGLYAIETAAEMIKNNQNSVVIIAASDHPDIYKYLWFKELKIYSEDGIIRPFCKNSTGLVFGDGGAAIVVEDLEHALKRNAPIYAEYVGGGFFLEGWQVTVPRIGGDSYQQAIIKACKHSNVDKKDIDLLCPHGVGAKVIDYYESKAITDIFQSPRQPFITTFKPYVGHNLGGSTLLETIILLLSLENNMILPTLNCNDIDPQHKISLVKEKISAKLNIIMKLCCAFAGYNAAVIFKAYSNK